LTNGNPRRADLQPNQWVRVIGGWSEFQFAEKRMPTLEELNAAAPETPVFVLHLYASAMLNRADLRAVGYTHDTPDPPGSEIKRDKSGNRTSLLIARPNARPATDHASRPDVLRDGQMLLQRFLYCAHGQLRSRENVSVPDV